MEQREEHHSEDSEKDTETQMCVVGNGVCLSVCLCVCGCVMSSCFFVSPAQGKTRVITKSVKQESFFQFFESVLGTTQCTRTPHTRTYTHKQHTLVSVLTFSLCAVSDPNEVEDPEDEEEQEKRALDFTRGEFFRDTFVPRALLYFTGEADQGEVCAVRALVLCACVCTFLYVFMCCVHVLALVLCACACTFLYVFMCCVHVLALVCMW